MKKIILFCTICAMFFSQAAAYAADNEADAKIELLSQSEDRKYDEALSLLCNLDFTFKSDKNAKSTVTREEFAYYLAYLYGIVNNHSAENDTKSNKYTGYTNEVKTDDWLWEADKPKQEEPVQIKETGTPFYDVTSENVYYEGIRFAAQAGFMTGNNGYFRPGERLTLAEMVKVMLDMLSATFTVKDSYPSGYLNLASNMKITEGLNVQGANSFVTYRDFIVCLRNTLETKNYAATTAASPAYEQNGLTLMENEFSVYSYKGIVWSNALTSLDPAIPVSSNRIRVGDNYYECDVAKYNDYLGYCVSVYYDKSSYNDDDLLYMAIEYASNETLEIDADDIESYEGNYLEYEVGKKTKKEYLGSQTIIIRNNILLDNYNESELIPSEGSVKFLDNNNDGRYEIAFIDAVETVLVNFVDQDKKTVYDKTFGKSVDFSKKGDLIITDINGDEVEMGDIKPNAVLEVRSALEKQNPQKTWISVIYKTLSGAPSAINTSDETVTIDNKEYELSAYADEMTCKLGVTYIFYLDSRGKIVGWSANDSGMQSAYLIKISPDDAGDRFYVRLWEYDQNKFTTYEFADKVEFNGIRVPAKNAAQSPEVKNGETGKTIAQIVNYKLNGDNKINEFSSESSFTTLYIGDGSSIQYRTIPGAFMSTEPEFYADQTTPYLKVPTENVTNEELYSIDTLQQDKKYKVTAAYTDKEDSMKASVIIEKQQDSAANVTVSSDREPVYIITGIGEEYADGELYITLTCENNSGQKRFLVEQKDRFSVVNDYHLGDLIRATYYEKTMKVLTIERVFDCEKMMFDDTSYYWSDTYSNPIKGTNLTDQHYVAGFGLAHGTPLKRFDDGELMQLALYGYSRDEESKLVVDKDTPDNTLLLKTEGFTVYKFDRERRLLDKLNVSSSVFDADSTGGNGSEIIAYSVWGEPKIIFMYE
ncbi:MAG: S-layer homology domain-containing protein [Clostridiales bacterium]|nr:S-layer homology domain-containing protein [Clostridiales bacterium]